MRIYSKFEINNDIFKHRKHIYYLCGNEQGTNSWFIVASYSIKTKQITLKDIDNFIPSSDMLEEFVKISNERYNKGVV